MFAHMKTTFQSYQQLLNYKIYVTAVKYYPVSATPCEQNKIISLVDMICFLALSETTFPSRQLNGLLSFVYFSLRKKILLRWTVVNDDRFVVGHRDHLCSALVVFYAPHLEKGEYFQSLIT